MSIISFCGVFLSVVIFCMKSLPVYVGASLQTIEYEKGSQYVVVVVETNGVTEEDAKKYAEKRAAEMTVAKGGRYFQVVSQQQTKVVKSDKSWPNSQALPQNLYQELIVEQDFGRESLKRRDLPSSSVYPAYRLVFEIKEDPSGIDACGIVNCKK